MSSQLITDVRKLEKYVMTLPVAKKLNMLSRQEQEAVIGMTGGVTEARINISKYLSSDDTDEQAKLLSAGIESLETTNKAVLAASQLDLIDAADVAHLSALADHINERLQ